MTCFLFTQPYQKNIPHFTGSFDCFWEELIVLSLSGSLEVYKVSICTHHLKSPNTMCFSVVSCTYVFVSAWLDHCHSPVCFSLVSVLMSLNN